MTARARRLATVALGGAALLGCSLLVDTSDLAGDAPIDGTQAGVDAGPRPDVLTSDAPAEGASCGPEIDLTSDPRNCARCGHDCLGGSCTDSRCQPTLFQNESDQPVGLATDGTELFWTTLNGHVRAIRLDRTGAVRELATVASAAGYLDLDADFVYAATLDDGHVVRIPKAGGSFEQIMTCSGNCLGIVVRGGNVYFTDRGPQSLRQVGPDGGTTILGGLNFPEALTADDKDFYIANDHGDAVVKVARSGGTGTDFVKVTDPVAVAVDANEIWVVSQGPGVVYRRPLAGGTLEPMATGQQGPTGILLTADAVYWAALGGRRIVRLAR